MPLSPRRITTCGLVWVAAFALGLLLAAGGDSDSGQQAGQKKTPDASDEATSPADSGAQSDALKTDSGPASTHVDTALPDIPLIPCSGQFDKKCPSGCDVFNDVDCCLKAPGCQWEADQCTCGSPP